MAEPVLKIIMDSLLPDGTLPKDFSLPAEALQEGDALWAAGAQDGVYLYHMIHEEPEETAPALMVQALTQAAAGQIEEAMASFAEWVKKDRAICVIDILQKYIIAHMEQLPAPAVYRLGIELATTADKAECVKLGMALLELFSLPDEGRRMIRVLSLCDEFSLFGLWVMDHWDNANEEVFELAQRVRGWGRIHAVKRLEPDTEEIRRWMLFHGTDNDVMAGYSALVCWKGAEARQVLYGTPTQEEYVALSALMEAMLDEGPVSGISMLEDAKEVLLRFLEITPQYEIGKAERRVIEEIRDWAKVEGGEYEEVKAACEKLLG